MRGRAEAGGSVPRGPAARRRMRRLVLVTTVLLVAGPTLAGFAVIGVALRVEDPALVVAARTALVLGVVLTIAVARGAAAVDRGLPAVSLTVLPAVVAYLLNVFALSGVALLGGALGLPYPLAWVLDGALWVLVAAAGAAVGARLQGRGRGAPGSAYG